MANLIQLKRASNYNVSENPGSQTLAEGELAWNNKGDTLWIGKRIATTGTQFNLKRLNPVIQGTSNEIEVTASAADAVNHIAAGETLTVGLPNDVTVGNNLTVNGNCILGNATSDTVTIAGDLTVNGTTTTINSTTLTVDDKDLVLGSVANPDDSTANTGGITLKGADDKKLTYSSTGDKWVFNKALDVGGSLDVTGNIVVSGTVDGRDVAADGTKLNGIADNANNFAMTISHDAGTAAAFNSGDTLNITGGSGITVNRSASSYTLVIDTSSVCTIDATQILTNKTIDGGTF